MRRRGSSKEGTNEPVRVLGIVTVTSPAAVVSVFGRDPLRWVVRVGVRSCGPAPIAAVASSSMSAWSAPVTSRLTNCPPSAVRSTSSRSCKTDLSRATAWAPLCEFLGRSHRASRDASPLPAVTRCRLAKSPRLPTPRKGTHLDSGHRDLHAAHVPPVPDRLEDAVGEPEDQEVLDRLLTQVVVDPGDRALREDRVQRCG